MSLPPILRYVYNHGTEEVIRRGKKIFATSGVQMLGADHLVEQVRFRVRNDLYQNYYTVTVTNYLNNKELAVRCQCPYNLGEICRHEVAALFQLSEIVQSGFFEDTAISYDQRHTIVRMRQITRQMLQLFSSPQVMDDADRLVAFSRISITSDNGGRVVATVADDDEKYEVKLQQNEDMYFDTSCTCAEAKYPVCVHKAAVLLHILKLHGGQYFQSGLNKDFQKNKLLEQYGYSLKDNLTGKFSFHMEDGKPFLRVLDPSIKKLSQPGMAKTHQAPAKVERRPEVEEKKVLKRVGIVIDTTPVYFPYVDFVLIEGLPDESGVKFSGGIGKIELSQFVNTNLIKEEDRDLVQVVRKFHQEEILRFLRKNLPFGDFLPDQAVQLDFDLSDDTKDQVWEYLLPKYQKLLDRYSAHPFIYRRSAGKLISSAGIEKIEFCDRPAHPQLIARAEDGKYLVELQWIVDQNAVAGQEVAMLNQALLMHNGCLYCVSNITEVKIAAYFPPDGLLKIEADHWQEFLGSTLMPWSEQIHVHFSEELIAHVIDEKPLFRVYLQERERSLIIRPVYVYRTVEEKPLSHGDVLLAINGIVEVIKRNQQAETAFFELLQSVHSEIHFNKKEQYFLLSETSVLSGNWFSRFIDLMTEYRVDIVGYSNLRNLRVSVFKPETVIHVSSGIDWFDANIELKFGDQRVTVADVKKAMSQRQSFVKLADGTIGLLPDEWVKKYGMLLKMGETKGSKVRLKKVHFGILDELLDELDETSQIQELTERKAKLEAVLTKDYTEIAPPEHLKAVLRPYQLAGFHWIKFLNESGWGGILADDMGLGKTVQTLTFFQHYKNEHQGCRFLVVCPTTLMYNWEKEIVKFTPTLTRYIHHGPKRNADPGVFQGYDIIITTYGTMRSDIKRLREIEFDYVVLDESQSIKNPQSQVARASMLLQSKNRLALSGTPVQNNTFDLYSQMNFLNPGMLGSREFFMNEFANPIDKFREDDIRTELRKLTHPFLLRRSKEQVAKDLPDKTEMILYCEMGVDQRKIYDAYRNVYRSKILGMIEEQGLEKSQMHILQGLTRLRQICDSPAIINEEEKFHNYSVKLDELSREITENVGDHKVLVFSQFLGMLALVRERLESESIRFVYFDGSTSATERERSINEFQGDPECRVFLISLKAGGIGLNLTAADYVYIVDPWWNPAVEQQAIDRTHRIGQTKNIFAYRLICKDTIEEKMLQLQEQKRALANDLISDDSAIMKRLNKDDIAFLFS